METVSIVVVDCWRKSLPHICLFLVANNFCLETNGRVYPRPTIIRSMTDHPQLSNNKTYIGWQHWDCCITSTICINIYDAICIYMYICVYVYAYTYTYTYMYIYKVRLPQFKNSFIHPIHLQSAAKTTLRQGTWRISSNTPTSTAYC